MDDSQNLVKGGSKYPYVNMVVCRLEMLSNIVKDVKSRVKFIIAL